MLTVVEQFELYNFYFLVAYFIDMEVNSVRKIPHNCIHHVTCIGRGLGKISPCERLV